MTRRHQYQFLTTLFGSLLLASTAAQAQTWSSIMSACQPAIDSAGMYTFNGASFLFSDSNVGQIRTRCAVTNPLDSGVPNWGTLTVGYVDPDGTGIDYQVDVQLVRVNRGTGATGIIKTFDSSAFVGTGPTSHSISFNHNFDFTNYAYYLSVSVSRADTAQSPKVWFASLK